MTLSNDELIQRFAAGYTSGRANNMEIREGPISYDGFESVHEGETAVVAYGWAVYAKRTEGGRIILYNGWREWANGKSGQSGQTTLQHLSKIEDAAGPTMMYDHHKAQCSSPPRTAETMRSDRV